VQPREYGQLVHRDGGQAVRGKLQGNFAVDHGCRPRWFAVRPDARRIAAVESVRSLTGESTVADLQSARDDVQSALDDVKSSVGDVKESDISDVESAYDDLTAAVDDLALDQSLVAALEQIQPELEALGLATDELFTTGCEAEPTPTVAAPTEAPPADTPVPGNTPTGAVLTAIAATEAAGAALTATIEAAIPEVKTAIVGTVVAQTAIAGTAVAETAVAATATLEAAVPEVKTAIVGTAVAAQTATAEAAPTGTPVPPEAGTGNVCDCSRSPCTVVVAVTRVPGASPANSALPVASVFTWRGAPAPARSCGRMRPDRASHPWRRTMPASPMCPRCRAPTRAQP
jgi:hypothetical protein